MEIVQNFEILCGEQRYCRYFFCTFQWHWRCPATSRGFQMSPPNPSSPTRCSSRSPCLWPPYYTCAWALFNHSGSRRQATAHITFSGSSSSPSSPSHCSLPCSFRLSNKPHCRHLVRRCHHYILSIKLTWVKHEHEILCDERWTFVSDEKWAFMKVLSSMMNRDNCKDKDSIKFITSLVQLLLQSLRLNTVWHFVLC